ncbi:MAG: ATP-binding protein [Verrucomicrobiales bacterium]
METAVVITLAGLCLWLGWRLRCLRKGIGTLERALRKAPLPALRDLHPSASGAGLRNLSAAALDTVAESTLSRDLEKQRRKFLEALLDEIKDVIFILDANREIRFVNEAGRELFPSDQPHVSRPFLEVCRDHRIYDTIELAEEIGSKVSDRIVLRIRQSTLDRMGEITLLVEAEPLALPDDTESLGSWVLMRDVTAELETEQIRRDFVANASHELRTPLSIINGYLESMDDPETDVNQPPFRRAIGTMRKHGERIARIVDDMLTISKLEDARDLLTREPFDLRDSLEDMIDQLMPIVEEHRAKIKVKADPEQSWILHGDRFYWDQIFFNLVENALKQNQQPGLRVRVSFKLEKGRYRISISDNGIGIPAADIPLVFKRFYRVQKHHAQTTKGTGLGLSIVKRAVEAHQGTISVDSRPGTKTTFTISVPQTGIPVRGRSPGRVENDK